VISEEKLKTSMTHPEPVDENRIIDDFGSDEEDEDKDMQISSSQL
jgi:hypothetical protein